MRIYAWIGLGLCTKKAGGFRLPFVCLLPPGGNVLLSKHLYSRFHPVLNRDQESDAQSTVKTAPSVSVHSPGSTPVDFFILSSTRRASSPSSRRGE